MFHFTSAASLHVVLHKHDMDDLSGFMLLMELLNRPLGQSQGPQGQGPQGQGPESQGHIVRGHRVRGHRVRGHRVRGHRVRGHRVRGHMVRATGSGAPVLHYSVC
ncbi:hypothetical protein EYF80_068277 [Liparis tanakae]|uniref:Uncharacterized protein n=1 Tax=Liparis tanakae TaxID=230148 RepID=A0A4Z2DYH0_9TELE|nr:hypothetical protein EYF80_068277 [Liparis tanakae]